MRKPIRKWSRFIHKWAGLVLALQILLWIFGGLVMSAIPLEKVHGKHLANKTLNQTIVASDFSYSLDALLEKVDYSVTQINYRYVLNEPYYFLSFLDKQQGFHGKTGKPFVDLDQAKVEQIATNHYLGEGEIQGSKLLNNIPLEASNNKAPLWQVIFDDTWHTTLYISNQSGQVTTIRSDIWRIFDFVWMLHIMDYDERDDFNNPLLITFAASSLIFTLSGFVLLYFSFVKRSFVKRSFTKRRL